MTEYREGRLDDPKRVPSQKQLTGKLEVLRKKGLEERASAWDSARLKAMSAPHAGAWLDAPPSRAQDTRFTNEEIRFSVGRGLGM